MRYRSIVAVTLLVLASLAAADEPASMQQQYLDHMNRILELAKEHQQRCLEAKSIDQCSASDEFTEMVNMMYQGMLTNPGKWPDDYFESLKRGGSGISPEEMIEKYRSLAPVPADDGPKTPDSEAI